MNRVLARCYLRWMHVNDLYIISNALQSSIQVVNLVMLIPCSSCCPATHISRPSPVEGWVNLLALTPPQWINDRVQTG